jgi:Domain of unknown function (DUF4136)
MPTIVATSSNPQAHGYPSLMRVLTVTIPLLLVAAVAAVAACGASSGSTMTVKTTGAEISSVAIYRTYTHATAETAPEGYARGPLRPVMLEKARGLVDAELQGKGYVLTENGELVVRLSTGRRTVEDQPVGRAAMAGAPATLETEGALVIDILERGTERKLFHGFASDVARGGDLKDEQLARAVSKILASVPASSP